MTQEQTQAAERRPEDYMRSTMMKLGLMAASFGMAGLLAVGCRDTSSGGGCPNCAPLPDMAKAGTLPDLANTGTPDMAMMGGGDDGGGTPPDMSGMMKVYVTTTIPMMRQSKSGPIELDNVVSITPSEGGNTLKAYLQDPAGGDFSAIQVRCSSTSMAHPCAKTGMVYTTLKNLAQGHSVTVQGTYIKSSMTKIEEFYLDSITDNGNAAKVPTPVTLQLTDIQRSGTMTAKWYQRVTVTLNDSLKVYDLSPVEFLRSAGCMTAGCPCQFGFALIPSKVGAAAAAACNGMMLPMSGMTNPNEIMVGTDFFKSFKLSSDCACAAKYMDTQVTPAMTVASGATISGILNFDSQFMTMNYYQTFLPLMDADLPLK